MYLLSIEDNRSEIEPYPTPQTCAELQVWGVSIFTSLQGFSAKFLRNLKGGAMFLAASAYSC